MTIQEVAIAIFRDFGIRTLTAVEDVPATSRTRGLGTGDAQAVARIITSAYQMIFTDGPSFISQRRMGSVLRARTSITAAVTQFSDSVTFTGFVAWMKGCTIRIPGDTGDNEILSSTKLVRPYMGSSGTVSVDVWGDSVLMDSSVIQILEPVRLPNYWHLQMLNSRQDLAIVAGDTPVVTPHTRLPGAGISYGLKREGQPIGWIPDTVYNETDTSLQRYLRVAPMPAANYPVEYVVKLKPPVVTAEDVVDTEDPETDPGISIPIDWVESVLCPIARQLATSDPMFDNDAGRQEIARQFSAARIILQQESPGVGTTTAVYK